MSRSPELGVPAERNDRCGSKSFNGADRRDGTPKRGSYEISPISAPTAREALAKQAEAKSAIEKTQEAAKAAGEKQLDVQAAVEAVVQPRVSTEGVSPNDTQPSDVVATPDTAQPGKPTGG